ncbi:MAG: xylulokinase [Pelolinea sp.]|nr:xylulokinase [Pelolinea sp.]
MKGYLGIDIGTSGVKALVINEIGQILATGYKECNIITPRPLWVEQDPNEWWNACKYAIKEAVVNSEIGMEIEAIGVSGQMLGNTMLDKNLKPIGNCMIWLDQRASKERDYIEEKLGIDEMLNITANYNLTGFWAPKLMWIKKNRPEVFEKTKMVLFPKDYIRLILTGEPALEVTDSSGTFLMDIAKRDWSDKMFEVCDLPKEIVPKRIFESCDIVGKLRGRIAQIFGLKSGIPVIAGGGDQTAGGIGNGVYKEGTISSSIGTSGVVFAATHNVIVDQKRRAAISICHSLPNTWCFFGCTLAAGGSFKWLRDTIFNDLKKKNSFHNDEIYEYMTALASESNPSSEGLMFLPYLNGERTPYPDENARGVFLGLSYRHGLSEICRSVMEGVTFSLRDTVEILRNFKIDIEEVRVSGGGAKSKLWRQMQADIFNTSVVTTNLEEGPSAGAAIMAAVGSGFYKSIEDACENIIRITSRTDPIKNNVDLYEDYYQIYKTLYPLLKSTFFGIGNLVNKQNLYKKIY